MATNEFSNLEGLEIARDIVEIECAHTDTASPEGHRARGALDIIDDLLAVERKARPTGNVWQYFRDLLQVEPTDATLINLPCDSGCGADCVGAIDAASKLLDYLTMAGTNMEHGADIVAACDATIQVFWRG